MLAPPQVRLGTDRAGDESAPQYAHGGKFRVASASGTLFSLGVCGPEGQFFTSTSALGV